MSFYKTVSSKKPNKKLTKNNDDLDEDLLSQSDEKKRLETLYKNFLEDWEKVRIRHVGQKQILHEFFELNKKYIFARIGRKGAKTTTNIDIAWRYAMMVPRSTTFICLPTITQAIEIYWDEKRLQWCDSQTDTMFQKYIRGIDNNKHMLTFVNDSTIKLIGTWSEARGRGTQPNLLIVDEIQDASAEYLDAMEPNLAAKADSRCVMSGTPPKKRNHYHEWEERIKKNPEGFHAEYSSYVNTALPHLKGWLDNKRLELISAGKEDVWLREYMAEDCFRSDDRVLPDLSLVEFEELIFKLKSIDPTIFQPILGLVVDEKFTITATYNVLFHSRYVGSQIYTLESQHIKRTWDRSYAEIYSGMKKKMEEYSSIFKKDWRKVVYDETCSLVEVVPGITNSRSDFKWSKRGIPLLKEMILANKLTATKKAGELAVECQNLLKEDKLSDYPTVCAMAMIANEYYQGPCLSRTEQEQWDKMAPLREAGIVTTLPKPKGLKPYRGKWD